MSFLEKLKKALAVGLQFVQDGASFAAPHIPGDAVVFAAVASMGKTVDSAVRNGGNVGIFGGFAVPGQPQDSVPQLKAWVVLVVQVELEVDPSWEGPQAVWISSMMYRQCRLLMLQERMQRESEEFPMLSNVSKTKHQMDMSVLNRIR